MALTKIGFYSMALVFLFANSYGQESRKHILDEFTFSVNRSRVSDNNTEDRWGFGFGVYYWMINLGAFMVPLIIGGAGASIPEVVLLTAIFKRKLVILFVTTVFTVATIAGFIANALLA